MLETGLRLRLHVGDPNNNPVGIRSEIRKQSGRTPEWISVWIRLGLHERTNVLTENPDIRRLSSERS